jgi:hypothetical protein
MISTERWILRELRAPLLVCAGVLAAACATSPPSAPPSKGRTETAPRCERGTLGLEAGPITRQLRLKLGLPEGAKGAVVIEVLPGSPAAAAGILANDVIEEIGTARITNDCELVDAAYPFVRPVQLISAGPQIVRRLVPVTRTRSTKGVGARGSRAAVYRPDSVEPQPGTDRDRRSRFIRPPAGPALPRRARTAGCA